MSTLNARQEKFIDEYLVDLNATQAAIRSGYSEKTAYSIGQRLLKHVEINARIEERRKKLHEKVQLSQEWVLEKLIQCVSKSMQEEEVQKWDYESKEMVGTGEYMYDSKGATKALELLGKHLKMFTDKTEISGEVGIKIVDDIDEED